MAGTGALAGLTVWTGRWWTLAARGALAILFGIVALVWPGITLQVLVVVLGVFLIVDGIFAAVFAINAPSGARTPFVIEAITGIGLGLIALVWPDATLLILTLLVGAWALVRGLFTVFGASQLPADRPGKGWVIAGGVLTALFGVLVLLWPISGAFAMAIVAGCYAIAIGILLIVAAWGVRRLEEQTSQDARLTQGDHELGGAAGV